MAETQNTGQFAKTIVTDVGKDMIAKSQNGQTLTFSRVALGDGLVGEEEDVTKFTAVKNERLSLPIAKYSNLGNGQFQIQFRLTNSQVESGFWHREIGIMAKIDNGQEQLYAYTTAGNKASFIYDKTTPVEERIVNVNFVIGNAQNLEVIINSSVIYATIEDLEEALDAHDAGADAHEPAFDAHNAADDAHKDFTGATAETAGKRGMVPAPAAGDQNKALFGDKSYKSVVQSINGITPDAGGGITLVTGINMLARNQAYQYGDIAYSNNLPSWAYFYCVQAGATAASEPSFSGVNTMGQYITDGTVKWIVDDVRFNIPVGVPFYDTYLHDGCVKLNGATVNRADYIRPAKIATDKSLWTSSPSTEPYKYGNGNGSTTMKLPDYRNRVIQGGDITAIKAAGLPNIEGTLNYSNGSTSTGADAAASGIEGFSGCFLNRDDTLYIGVHGNVTQSYPMSAPKTPRNLKFSASNSNSIYGSSITVQSPAIVLIPQIRY